MSPVEMIDALDAAIARAESGRARKRDVALTLVGRATVLGCRGRHLSDRADGTAVYGFTLAQCRAMLDTITAAIREDIATFVGADGG